MLSSKKKQIYYQSFCRSFGINKRTKGEHVLVAVQSPNRIVFVVKILKEIPKEKPVKVTSEEVVAAEPMKLLSIDNN